MIDLTKLKTGQLIYKIADTLRGSLEISNLYEFLGYDLETKIFLIKELKNSNETRICREENQDHSWYLFPKKFLKFVKEPIPKQPARQPIPSGTGDMTAEKFFGKVNKTDMKEVEESKKEFQKNRKPIPQIQAPELPGPPTDEGPGSGGRGHWV